MCVLFARVAPEDRMKYGVLNVGNDPAGVRGALRYDHVRTDVW